MEKVESWPSELLIEIHHIAKGTSTEMTDGLRMGIYKKGVDGRRYEASLIEPNQLPISPVVAKMTYCTWPKNKAAMHPHQRRQCCKTL